MATSTRRRSIANSIKSIAVPTVIGDYTYTGNTIIAKFNYNTKGCYVLSGGSSINAGTHTAIFRLNQGYMWKDKTTADKEVTWTIQKMSISEPSLQIDSGVYGAVYYYYNNMPHNSNPQYDTAHVGVSGTATAVDEGVYDVIFTLLDTNNYKWATTGESSPKTKSWEIVGIDCFVLREWYVMAWNDSETIWTTDEDEVKLYAIWNFNASNKSLDIQTKTSSVNIYTDFNYYIYVKYKDEGYYTPDLTEFLGDTDSKITIPVGYYIKFTTPGTSSGTYSSYCLNQAVYDTPIVGTVSGTTNIISPDIPEDRGWISVSKSTKSGYVYNKQTFSTVKFGGRTYNLEFEEKH